MKLIIQSSFLASLMLLVSFAAAAPIGVRSTDDSVSHTVQHRRYHQG
jgi:hypothetical protein